MGHKCSMSRTPTMKIPGAGKWKKRMVWVWFYLSKFYHKRPRLINKMNGCDFLITKTMPFHLVERHLSVDIPRSHWTVATLTLAASGPRCSVLSRNSPANLVLNFRIRRLKMRSALVYLLILGLFKDVVTEEGFCSAPSVVGLESDLNPLYLKVDDPTLSPMHLQDLPGFTRSVYKRDHALISPESHVYGPLPDWINTSGAYLIAPEMGSHFVMYLAKLQEKSKSGLPQHGVERFIFVLRGVVTLATDSCSRHILKVDTYAYLPPNYNHIIECDASATIVVFERRYAPLKNHVPELIVNSTYLQPLLETPGEVFELRKLLPTSLAYGFNIHVMDFQPGEFLNVKEVHYNQHGLLLLEGQGIYRLGDSWYPVQAGDVIWMAPFVPQWYAALGKTRTRYLLYKDVNRNPL